jgi:predicted ATPase
MLMRIQEVALEGYRSLRSIRFPVGKLTVFVGANGVGKTNLYRALQLVQSAAAGSLARDLASEGGMESALWAGKRAANKSARMKFQVGMGTDREVDAGEHQFDYTIELGVAYSYEIEVGVRAPTSAAFPLEPQVKEERLIDRGGRRPITLLERRGPQAKAVDNKGQRQNIEPPLLPTETALGSMRDPGRFGDVDLVRRTLLDWRFYHDFRTDRLSPLRQPCLAVTTPTLASDGSDLAALFATLVHIREDTMELDRAIDDAFPGAQLVVPAPERAASFGLIMPDYPKRVFDVAELSDGTLRYLALTGALLGYRLPAFIALNEPETSLHPELLEPLARTIARAARRTQIWVVTHSERFADALAASADVKPRTVIKRDGGTWIEGLKLYGEFDEDEGNDDS